jgi:hypothetical protein
MAKSIVGKGSWFGGPNDGMDSGKTAAGFTTARPGVAIRPGGHYESGRPYLKGYWKITAPNGRSAILQQTDIGPNQSTGRRVDVTYSALGKFGYNEKNFPTDGRFRATYLGKKKPVAGAPVDAKTGGTKAPSTVTTGQDIRPLVDWIKNRKKGASVVDLANAMSAARGTTTAVPTTQGTAPKAPKSKKSSGSPNKIYELFYDPQGGWKMGSKLAQPIGGHGGHVHVAADGRRIKWIGKQAQKMGLRVGENKSFSGSTPTGGHATNSYHYKNEAIDVSGDSQKMADFTRWVRRNYNLPK